MRDILFKAKRKSDGKWVEGYYIKAKYHWHEYGIHEDWIVLHAIQNGGFCNVTGRVAVDPETVSQYIGLCDKNGKKIFENDIVTSGSDSTGRKYYSAVYYDEFNCSCCNGVYGWTFVEGCGDIREYKEYEVVGNVFDNYELLEQPEGN